MPTHEPSPEPFGGWLEALHDAVANDRAHDFTPAPDDTVSREQLAAVRDCFRQLEQLRRSTNQASTAPALHDNTEPGTFKQIGRFRIIREVGRGGFGVVFLAFDPKLGRQVALKVPRPEILMSTSMRRRFLREAKAAGALSHPNLIPIHEVGEDGPLCYIASAYCPGPNLAQWLTDHLEPVSIRQAVELIAALARGIEHAHRRGVTHRDIKPANVLLDPLTSPSSAANIAGMTPRLTDFGLAKMLEGSDDETRTGSLLGTPAYMAPEQAEARHDEIGPATDVYALGVILYELVAGRPPYRGQSDVQTLQQVTRGEAIRPSRLREGLSKDLEAIILKCFECQPERRYHAAIELANDLDRYLQNKPTLARPAGALVRTGKWMRRRPAVAGLVSVVILAAILLSGGGWWYSGRLSAALEESRAYAADVKAHELTTKRFLHVANVNLAERAMTYNRVRQARELLERDVPADGEPDVRGFAWHLLQRRLNDHEQILVGHTGEVYCVRFSPNDQLLATGSQDQTVRLWNREDGTCLGVLRGHTNDVNGVAFSPDGQLLASASGDGTVRIWEVATQSLRQTFVAHERGAFNAVFSPDGSRLATCGKDNNVRIWSTESWQQVAVLEGHTDDVGIVVFSRQGDLLSGSADKTLRVWDLATGRSNAERRGYGSPVNCIAISRDGDRLVSVGRQDHVARVCDTLTGAAPREITVSEEWINDAILMGQEKQIAVADKEGAVCIFDVATSEVVARCAGHADQICSLALSADERYLASASADRTVKIWNLVTGTSHERIANGPMVYPVAAISPDGDRLFVAHGILSLSLWSLDSQSVSWQREVPLPGCGKRAHQVVFNPAGDVLALSQFEDGRVQLWDVNSEKRIGLLQTRGEPIDSLAFTPDGQSLAIGARDGDVTFWSMSSREPLHHFSTGERAFVRLAFSPDGSLLAVGSKDGNIQIWDAARRERLATLTDEAPYDIAALQFSPDGATLAAAGNRRVINLWNVAARKKIATLAGHTGGVGTISFSPDGRCLASGAADGRVKLWDLATKQDIYTVFHAPKFEIFTVLFHPDGNRLFATTSQSTDSGLHVWNIAPEMPPSDSFERTARIDDPSAFDYEKLRVAGTVAVDDRGNGVTVHLISRSRPARESIAGRRFDALGASRGTEIFLDTQLRNFAPAVAMNAQGDFAVTWIGRHIPTDHAVFVQRFNADGVRRGTEIRVSEKRPVDRALVRGIPSVGIDARGGFAVAWEAHDGARRNVYVRRYDALDQPLGDEIQVSSDSKLEICSPCLSMTAEGDCVVAWTEERGKAAPSVVMARRFNAAGEALDAQDLQVSPAEPSAWHSTPAVAMHADRSFVVSWTNSNVEHEAQSGDVYLRRFQADGQPRGSATLVNDCEAPRSAARSSVAIAASGEMMVCWTNQAIDADGSLGVFARRFAADGVAQESEFQVPEDWVGDQFGSCVAATDADFVVSWTDHNRKHRGVYTRRFEQAAANAPPQPVSPQTPSPAGKRPE